MKTLHKALSVLCALSLLLALFAGCGGDDRTGQSGSGEEDAAGQSAVEPDGGEGETPARTEVNVGALQGPTGMGMAPLMAWALAGETANDYNFTLDTAPDVIQGKLVSGELDIAALPTNVAAVLYQRTGGEVSLLAVNTLGVLYIVQRDGAGVESLDDLAGMTIATAGQGSTQQYVLDYLLGQAGLTGSVTIDYRSEHAEVATLLLEGMADVVLLPQPFVTTVTARDAEVSVAVDITQEWERATGATLTMGCLVARKDFLDRNTGAVNAFLEEYGESTRFVNANVDEAAAMIGDFGIVDGEVARAAIPLCNIVCLTGSGMMDAAAAYLEAIAAQDMDSVGGKLPDDTFYYFP